MLRILHVFGRLDRNGAETMIMNVYRNINRDEIQFDFIVHSNDIGDYEEEIQSLGGRIFRCPRYFVFNHFLYVLWWKKFFLEHDYSIIHSHVRSTAAIYIPIFKRITHGKAIIHSHSSSSGTGISALLKNFLQFPLRFEADYFLACSCDAGRWLFGKKTILKDSFHVLNNGIELSRYAFKPQTRNEYRQRYNLNGKFVVGHVGRFVEAKNHFFLIDAFNEIYKKNHEARLMLIGRGELESSIRKHVKQLGLENAVLFMGNRSDVPELMSAMDVFAFPSKYEGLGMAAIEAQAAGLPVLCSSQIPEEAYATNLIKAVDLKHGISYYAEAIACFADKSNDRTLYVKLLSEQGWGIEQTVTWLTNFYFEIIN